MKNLEFGNNFERNNLALIVNSDIISSRSINRPIRQLYEHSLNNEEFLKQIVESTIGDGIVTGFLEEFNIKNLKLIKNEYDKKYYLRIPTGAIIDGGKLYINAPEPEAAERALSNYLFFNLNEKTNNLVIKYEVVKDEEGEGNSLKYTYELNSLKIGNDALVPNTISNDKTTNINNSIDFYNDFKQKTNDIFVESRIIKKNENPFLLENVIELESNEDNSYKIVFDKEYNTFKIDNEINPNYIPMFRVIINGENLTTTLLKEKNAVTKYIIGEKCKANELSDLI